MFRTDTFQKQKTFQSRLFVADFLFFESDIFSGTNTITKFLKPIKLINPIQFSKTKQYEIHMIFIKRKQMKLISV